MANKKEGVKLGVSGFILGLLSIAIIPLLAIILLLGPSITGIIIGVVGLVFGIIQQKRKKTKLGKIGIILNIIGIVVGIISLFVVLHYIMPMVQQQMQSFPTA